MNPNPTGQSRGNPTHRVKGSRSRVAFFAWMVVIVTASALALLQQRQAAVALRAERDLAELETREWERLRAEHTRLQAAQISTAELQALRADHAALPRLRAELDALRRAANTP
jgi:hypothetical protein